VSGSPRRERAAGWAAAAAFTYLLYLAGLYLVYPGYVDHGEPSVALIAWRLLDGQPAYPPFDAPGRITNLYGPFAYLPHSLVFAFAGASTAAGKAAALAATVTLPAVVWLTWRGRGLGALAALIAVGALLVNTPASLWNRPDSLIALLVALAVLAVGRAEDDARVDDRASLWPTMILAAAAGAAVNMKIHAGVYFLPLVLFHLWGRGPGAWVVLAVTAAGVAVAPFLTPLFPLGDYLAWFGPMSAKPNESEAVANVARWGAWSLVPLVAFFAAAKGRTARDWIYAGSYALMLVVVFFPASKPGAGSHYYLPFAAVALDILLRYGREARTGRMLAAGLAIVLLVVAVPIQKRFHRGLDWPRIAAVRDDIRRIAAAFPSRTLQMGLGDNVVSYRDTFYKTVLVFAGHPYTLDGAIVIETSFIGLPLSPATYTELERCRPWGWLVPKGEEPFALIGYYGNRVFDDEFRQTFRRTYRLAGSFTYFDVWGCATAS
jgi:hypothetical protein